MAHTDRVDVSIEREGSRVLVGLRSKDGRAIVMLHPRGAATFAASLYAAVSNDEDVAHDFTVRGTLETKDT